jgi:undecaprenyl-diphosphatase
MTISCDQIQFNQRLLVGTLNAFVVARLSIGWLLRYVASHSFVACGIHRIAAGALILGLLAAGWFV